VAPELRGVLAAGIGDKSASADDAATTFENAVLGAPIKIFAGQ
jgi:hypothetical protein